MDESTFGLWGGERRGTVSQSCACGVRRWKAATPSAGLKECLLTTNVPHVQFEAIVDKRFDVEPLRWSNVGDAFL